MTEHCSISGEMPMMTSYKSALRLIMLTKKSSKSRRKRLMRRRSWLMKKSRIRRNSISLRLKRKRKLMVWKPNVWTWKTSRRGVWLTKSSDLRRKKIKMFNSNSSERTTNSCRKDSQNWPERSMNWISSSCLRSLKCQIRWSTRIN